MAVLSLMFACLLNDVVKFSFAPVKSAQLPFVSFNKSNCCLAAVTVNFCTAVVLSSIFACSSCAAINLLVVSVSSCQLPFTSFKESSCFLAAVAVDFCIAASSANFSPGLGSNAILSFLSAFFVPNLA